MQGDIDKKVALEATQVEASEKGKLVELLAKFKNYQTVLEQSSLYPAYIEAFKNSQGNRFNPEFVKDRDIKELEAAIAFAEETPYFKTGLRALELNAQFTEYQRDLERSNLYEPYINAFQESRGANFNPNFAKDMDINELEAAIDFVEATPYLKTALIEQLKNYQRDLVLLDAYEPFIQAFQELRGAKFNPNFANSSNIKELKIALEFAEVAMNFKMLINLFLKEKDFNVDNLSSFMQDFKRYTDNITDRKQEAGADFLMDVCAKLVSSMPPIERIRLGEKLKLLDDTKIFSRNLYANGKYDYLFNFLMGGAEYSRTIGIVDNTIPTTDLSNSTNSAFKQVQENGYAFTGPDSFFKDAKRKAFEVFGVDLLAYYSYLTGRLFPREAEAMPPEIIKTIKDALGLPQNNNSIDYVPQGVFSIIINAMQAPLMENESFYQLGLIQTPSFSKANFLPGTPTVIQLQVRFNNINNGENSYIPFDCTVSCELSFDKEHVNPETGQKGYYKLLPDSFRFSGHDAELLKQMFLGTASDELMAQLLEREKPINEGIVASSLSKDTSTLYSALSSAINREKEGPRKKSTNLQDIEEYEKVKELLKPEELKKFEELNKRLEQKETLEPEELKKVEEFKRALELEKRIKLIKPRELKQLKDVAFQKALSDQVKQLSLFDIELYAFDKKLYYLTAQFEADSRNNQSHGLAGKIEFFNTVTLLFSELEAKIKATKLFSNKDLIKRIFAEYKQSFYATLTADGTVFYRNLSAIDKAMLMATAALSSLANKSGVNSTRQAIKQEILKAVDDCQTADEVEQLFQAYQRAKHETPNNALKKLLVEWRRGTTTKSLYEDVWQNQTMETSRTDGEIIQRMQARKAQLIQHDALPAAQIFGQPLTESIDDSYFNDNLNNATTPAQPELEADLAGRNSADMSAENTNNSMIFSGNLSTLGNRAPKLVARPVEAGVVQTATAHNNVPSLENVNPKKPLISKSAFALIVVTAAVLSAAVVGLTAGFGLIPIAVGVGTVFAVKAAIYGAISIGAAVTSATAVVGIKGIKTAASSLVFGKKADGAKAAKATKPVNNSTNTPRAS